MSCDTKIYVDLFLALKAKAAKGSPWSKQEQTTVEHCLNMEGIISVLAACCVLASKCSKGWEESLCIIREAIGDKKTSPYVEQSIYEALIYLEPHHLVSFQEQLLHFIKHTLKKRAINLDNTIYVLGKMARNGNASSLGLLRSLESDVDPGVQNNVSLVLRGLPDTVN
jgi:hypothetical protein